MVVDTQLYDTLGVPPNASQQDIKQAFQRKARQLHPDKNKNDPNATANFQALNEAYEILKDPNKRREYDQFGLHGTRQNNGFGMDFFNSFMNSDPFEGFGFSFNRSNPFSNRAYRQYQKTDDITYTLKCSLEDLYNGSKKTLQLKRSRICDKCKGKGLKQGKSIQQCRNCNGTGQIFHKRQNGPNSVIMNVTTCSTCKGTGEFIRESDKCPKCQGQTVIDETAKIQVHITPGMENGEEIIFRGESNEQPNAEAGDFVVTIEEKPHRIFKRNFANLMIEKEITLSEALLGVKFPITHLDGRILIISSNNLIDQIKTKKAPKSKQTNLNAFTNKSFEVIQNRSVMMVQGEGMPYINDPYKKGDLFIYFKVKFPISNDMFSKEFCDSLKKTFPKSNDLENINLNDDDVYQVTLQDSNIEEFKNSKKTYKSERNEAYRSDSDSDNDKLGCTPM